MIERLRPIGFTSFIFFIGFLAFLPRTQYFHQNPDQLSIGILLDLCITLPLMYFLLIRKSAISNFTTLYVAILGLILAGFILPEEHQSLLQNVRSIAIPVIEILVLSVVFFKFRNLRKSYKAHREDSIDFHQTILSSCQEALPGRVASLLATEISVIYYLFAKTPKRELTDNEFTYDRKNGIYAVIGVFIFLLAIETFVVHILIAEWNDRVAWMLTLLGLYTGLQILGIIRSVKHRMYTLDPIARILHLRFGFSSQISIPVDNIASIELSRKSPPNEESMIALSPFHMLDPHNVIIHLKEEQTLSRIYGLTKKGSTIVFYVDEKERLRDAIEGLKLSSN